MDNLRDFARDYFKRYNDAGNRKAKIVGENLIEEEMALDIEYEYTSLGGVTRTMIKRFNYDENDNIVHQGPVEKN